MHEDHGELVEGHNVETGKHLVKKGAEVDARGKFGEPSFLSTRPGFHGYVKTARHPVKKGDWNDKKELQWINTAKAVRPGKPLFVAQAGHVKTEKHPVKPREVELHMAASRGDVDVVKSLVENGAEVNVTNRWGETALHKAAEERHVDVVKYLVENGAEVNATDEWDKTALHMAANEGHVDVVKCLVENGAKVNATDTWGDTALHGAAREGHVDVVKCLVENGKEVNATNTYGETALHRAAWRGHVDVVKYLVENGADVNATDDLGRTALHVAAEGGHVDVVKWLVEKGAQLDAKDYSGKVPLDLAEGRHAFVIKYLVDERAKGHNLVIKYLVDKRAKLDAIKEARSLALQFMSENPGCIRAVPYESSNEDTKPLTIRLYVDDDETGITDEFKDAAQEQFGDRYEIEYEDLLRPPLSNLIKPCRKHKEEELSSLSKIIEKHLHLFDNLLNVTAVCASYKVTDFIEEDTPCVTVFVLGKGRIPAGEKDINEIKRRCGPLFENTEFDVAEGYYRPAYGPSLESYTSPLRGGVGIGVRGRPAAGTLGGFLEDEEGKLYILSNEHVLNPRVGANASEIENPTGNVIQQPAQSDYARILKKARVKHKNWSSKKSKIERSKQDADNPDNYVHFDEDYVKLVERNLRKAGNELDIIESEEPRRIGEYVCGLQDNVEGHFVDAAIAGLDEKESRYIKSDKHSEDKIGRCRVYGFDNNGNFQPNGEVVDMADFVSDVTEGRKLMKIGKKTNFTNNGSVHTAFKTLFVKQYSATPKDDPRVSEFTHVQYAFCDDCIQSFSGDTEICYEKYECGSCGKRLDRTQEGKAGAKDPVWCFWAYNCLVIRKPTQPFSNTGDSGALVFGSDGRAWGLVFGTFTHPAIDCALCIASPLSIALKALEMKSGKKFQLWCTKEGEDSDEEGFGSEADEEKRENEESEQIGCGKENGGSDGHRGNEVIEENGVCAENGVNDGSEEKKGSKEREEKEKNNNKSGICEENENGEGKMKNEGNLKTGGEKVSGGKKEMEEN